MRLREESSASTGLRNIPSISENFPRSPFEILNIRYYPPRSRQFIKTAFDLRALRRRVRDRVPGHRDATELRNSVEARSFSHRANSSLLRSVLQDRRRRQSAGSSSGRYDALSGKLSTTSLRKDLSLPRIAAHSTDSLLESLRQDNRILAAAGSAATLGRSTSALGFASRQNNLPHAFSMDYIKLPHLSGE